MLGDNRQGQLGLGKSTEGSNESLRRLEDASMYVVGVRCAENQTLLRTFDGSLFTCGENEHMNQGLPDSIVEEGEQVFDLEQIDIKEPAWVLTGTPKAVADAAGKVKRLETEIEFDQKRLEATNNPRHIAPLEARLVDLNDQLKLAQHKHLHLQSKKIKDWKIKEVQLSGQHVVCVSNYGCVLVTMFYTVLYCLIVIYGDL